MKTFGGILIAVLLIIISAYCAIKNIDDWDGFYLVDCYRNNFI